MSVMGEPRVARGRTDGRRVTRPSLGLFLTEPARGLAELAGLWVATPWLSLAPRGDQHGVLVLPGLLASDSSTVLLRWFLGWLGYDVRGWSLARNLGPTDQVLDELPRMLSALAGQTGGPNSRQTMRRICSPPLWRRTRSPGVTVRETGIPLIQSDLY